MHDFNPLLLTLESVKRNYGTKISPGNTDEIHPPLLFLLQFSPIRILLWKDPTDLRRV